MVHPSVNKIFSSIIELKNEVILYVVANTDQLCALALTENYFSTTNEFWDYLTDLEKANSEDKPFQHFTACMVKHRITVVT